MPRYCLATRIDRERERERLPFWARGRFLCEDREGEFKWRGAHARVCVGGLNENDYGGDMNFGGFV